MITHRSRRNGLAKVSGRPKSLPAELSRVNLNAAGVDVGATSLFVAVPEGRSEQPVHEFGFFTSDLYRLGDWLAERRVKTVPIESTGGTGYPSSECWKSEGSE